MTRAILLLLVGQTLGCSASARLASPVGTTIRSHPAPAWTKGAMVSAGNPHAVAAAAEVLALGGHAVDAAIAAHAVLGLVEPESSGLGGSAFMLVYDRGRGTLLTYDGREMAPAGATAEMFMLDGDAMGFSEAWQTGLSVGVPGAVALYLESHQAHGKLSLDQILGPAMALAREGFEISPKLHNWLVALAPRIDAEATPKTAAIFYPGGEPLAVGTRLSSPEYASTLQRIVEKGRQGFYAGPTAEAMVERARRPPFGSPMTTTDVAGYAAKVRAPVCGPFRELKICSAPPPSSGLAQITIAGLYDRLLTEGESNLPDMLQAFVDAQRLAYADRDQYVADADFVSVPVAELTDPAYLDHRATERFAPGQSPTPGDPRGVMGTEPTARYGLDTTHEATGTTHLAIIDAEGNAVSMTASVGAPMGSLRWTEGFMLNNEMTDFAMTSTGRGTTVANVIEPNKRPRSSMSPTMVFDAAGEIAMVTGSPGGNSIVAYVSKSVLATLDWQLSAQRAVDFPNIIARGDTVRVEAADSEGEAIARGLRARGYDVQPTRGENSGIHLIIVRPDRLEGAADKRREGAVRHVE